ncbi:lysozyme inhibitor LprI family protein [Xanthomonas hydrangeae]|uniref:lysozyme inhibitor LprI family protein n=1 Tax=Xanthomonas hydrangeae TaxID=2775159 RepID=UPI001962AA37
MSMRYILLILTLLSCPALQAAPRCFNPATTAESNACWNDEVGLSQHRLNDYLAAARERAITELNIPAEAFDNAQTAWTSYRELQCDNVRRQWGIATVGQAKAASCLVELNDQRSHDLWKHYLTYIDRTPAIRPEPELRSAK